MASKDTQTGDAVQSIKVTCKDGTEKWRIKTGESYRYITQKEIDTYQIRKKIESTPKEEIQRRNNVEATIFQVSYHYPNAKSRYRGLSKHQMWANMRCLWVNFVRIVNFVVDNGQKMSNIALNFIKTIVMFYTGRQIIKALIQDINFLSRQPKSTILCNF
ncbi:MAG: transposase [Saprospiraceae bacterium]|nr:transposase [Saprospiraceae bacterium]